MSAQAQDLVAAFSDLLQTIIWTLGQFGPRTCWQLSVVFDTPSFIYCIYIQCFRLHVTLGTGPDCCMFNPNSSPISIFFDTISARAQDLGGGCIFSTSCISNVFASTSIQALGTEPAEGCVMWCVCVCVSNVVDATSASTVGPRPQGCAAEPNSSQS